MPYARPCIVGQAGKLFIGVSWLRRTVRSLLAQPTCTSRQHSVHLFSSVYRRSQATAVRLCLYQRVCWQFQQRSLPSYRLSQPTAKATAVSTLSVPVSLTSYCLHVRAWCTDAQDFAQCKALIFWPTCIFSRLLYSAWYVTSRQCKC